MLATLALAVIAPAAATAPGDRVMVAIPEALVKAVADDIKPTVVLNVTVAPGTAALVASFTVALAVVTTVLDSVVTAKPPDVRPTVTVGTFTVGVVPTDEIL